MCALVYGEVGTLIIMMMLKKKRGGGIIRELCALLDGPTVYLEMAAAVAHVTNKKDKKNYNG